MKRYAWGGLLVFVLGGLAMGQAGARKNDEGVLPVGADGKPLNLDFETGTLKDWTAEGKAFEGQPIKGDTVFPRRSDMRSQHQGRYWIGSYECFGDKPQGTLTSVPFKVTHPWASFLVAGGSWPETCVELAFHDTKKVFFRASGLEEENLRRVVVDLKPHLGRAIFIRLVDRHSGHWGHINFDDFRFHAEKPSFPPRPVKEAASPADEYKFAGLPPEKAAQVMTVPEGFDVKLFAGEPDVHQPIAMCLDDRGRVWVAEAYTYPGRHPHPGPVLPENEKSKGDRILIFEDTDGDGKFDKRTVFMEGLNLVSGLEVGFGGVWIGAAPYLLFVPMKDDRPAGPPQVLLDGWGYEDTHETLNSFIWGPDGWLYGCHGVFTHSRVGKPGTPNERRIPINAGIWRYHPTRHVFEVFAHGTSNPWGLDFDDWGQAFCEACVIPHAFHIIQGGRYHRQAGNHFNPHTYADIQTIADHRHYLGPNPHGGNNRSDGAGGGHAHCGLMIYLGGAWPEKYRNQMFMSNIHGRRLNMDVLKPKGSGYVASHGPDFLLANDAWARFINMRYGPDGNVYLIDWYDKQACHHTDPRIWDRNNGRVYKICYRGTKPAQVDLQKLSDLELAKLQLHENDWYVRHSRRILQERAKLAEDAVRELRKIALDDGKETRRLRGLWVLHAAGLLDRADLGEALKDKSPHVRAWALQLGLEETRRELLSLDSLVQLAEKESSPVVRLYLASGLQRLQFDERERILPHLLAWAEDAGDHNLPLLYWYGLEPLAGTSDHSAGALKLAMNANHSQLLAFTVRRIGESLEPREALDARASGPVETLVAALAKIQQADVQLVFLRGMNEALKGRRQVPMPRSWPGMFPVLSESKNAEVRAQALTLAVTFGDPRAFAHMRDLLVNKGAEMSLRQNALAALLGAKDSDLPPVLHRLLAESSLRGPSLRGPSLRGLALYDHANTPEEILSVYGSLNSQEKRDALSTLASRGSYARVLLDAVAAKKVAAVDVSADIVRQLRNLQDKQLNARIGEVWGVVRDTPADRVKMLAHYKILLSKPAKVDLSLGRAVYAKTCAQCHTLFGIGGKVGPDITGANRASLDYLLENIIDPSAIIPKEYAATLIEMKDGRVITGIVRQETPAAVTVLTADDTLILPRKEIESQKASDKSMMPDDAVQQLKEHELRALIAYLQSPAQVPMLATPDNVKDFFNGKDLTGWDGDAKLWGVEKGEIIGKSPGIKRNEFLRSHLLAADFRLTLKVKLTPDTGNSGVQFRSEPLPDGEMKGPQADIGAGWWGKLYDESGRGLIWDKSGEPYVKKDQWNDYEIVAQGSKIRTYINGKLCVDLDDPAGPRRGIFALQIHSGPPMEVRFRELRLEVLPKGP